MLEQNEQLFQGYCNKSYQNCHLLNRAYLFKKRFTKPDKFHVLFLRIHDEDFWGKFLSYSCTDVCWRHQPSSSASICNVHITHNKFRFDNFVTHALSPSKHQYDNQKIILHTWKLCFSSHYINQMFQPPFDRREFKLNRKTPSFLKEKETLIFCVNQE